MYKNICRNVSKSLITFVSKRVVNKTYIRNSSFKSYNFTIKSAPVVKYLEFIKHEYWNLYTSENVDNKARIRLDELLPVMKILEEKECVEGNLKNLDDINSKDEEDKDMKELIAEERQVYENILKQIESKLLLAILPKPFGSDVNKIMIEITAGVGGKEAMLFARELFDMYCGYINYKGWDYRLAEFDESELGGIRHAGLLVEGDGAYRNMNFEGGVHRVQRNPATEKSGRIHTSTATVAVLPQPNPIDIQIKNQDLKIETKRASGAGGQHVNTTDSAVRIVHIPSGIAVECQTDRSQIKNREIAMDKLRTKLYEQQITSQETTTKNMRKSQVGASNRNEKIRTYNYNQDRITDHRLSYNIHNIKVFMEGGEPLQKLIDNLDEISRFELLDKLIHSIPESYPKMQT